MPVIHAHEVKASPVSDAVGVSKKVLIAPEEGPNFALRVFTIQPGGKMPNHTNLVEHEQYVLEGRAEVYLDGRKYSVQRGDAVLIPAGVPHWYINTGDEPFEFICVVPNLPDKTTLIQ